MQAPGEIESFLDDGDQNVDRDGGPNLRLDSVLRSPVKSFDAQMLLDPAKEQLHLPTALIELGNRQRGEKKVVGQKHETLLSQRIEITYPPKSLGIASFGNGVVEPYDLIALQAGRFVDGWEPIRWQSKRFLARVTKNAPD